MDAAEDVDIKLEMNEEPATDIAAISPDSVVTCGCCKEQMIYQKYDSEHRSNHYNLCWLDGKENEIDFTDTSLVITLLRKFTYKCKTKIQFKCHWCNEMKLSASGFANHLKNCKRNSISSVMNEESGDKSLEQLQSDCNQSTITYNDDSEVSCACCGESMNYEEYKQKHRHKHYNLCWLEGEEKLDYSDVNKIISLLRKILPKNAERDRKVLFKCERCGDQNRSVGGYAKHVKKCFTEQETNSVEVVNENTNTNSMVVCGHCNQSMLFKEYETKHKLSHYNLCWIVGDEKPNFDDEAVVNNLLRKAMPKHAARQKKVIFTCEWCQTQKKSVLGFLNHIKQCQLKPDKLGLLNNAADKNNSVLKTDIKITKERDESMVTCGRCRKEMTFNEYRTSHSSKHYNLCWIEGETKPNLEEYETVLAILKQYIPFSATRNRTVKLTCEDCKSVKKSVVGFASHIIYCNKSNQDIQLLLVQCADCGLKIKQSSLGNHKLFHCKGFKLKAAGDVSVHNKNDTKESSNKLKRKKRPPNVLSFHPNTKYITEYYDYICLSCDFSTLNTNDILNHISAVHNIAENTIQNNLNKYVSSEFDMYRNIFMRPLLNYYNFYKKTFWKANFHEDFQPVTKALGEDEALKYLPTVQQSCMIVNKINEGLYVDMFKSVHVNGMYWLFTGGPNWAMAWCPVPMEVQTQYLAISCHPEPDLVHKEMELYKYPSLLQLWNFDSLSCVNYKTVSDMPYMSYGIAHEYGAVWDMAWCPSGAYESNKKIGLLALSTSCGDCPIIAMPHVVGNPKEFQIYDAKCVVARNFECESTEAGVQCKKVCWQAVPPFKTLICGYSNGMVSIFHINFKSIFMNDDILYPSHTFRASKCSLTGLSINYLNPSILATTSIDGNTFLWDLNSTENPVFQKKFYAPSDCTWLQQCYTLVHCSNGVNPLFLKVRSINFSSYEDDITNYNEELYVLTDTTNRSKVISSNYSDMVDKTPHCDNIDESLSEQQTTKKTSDLNVNSDDDSSKSYEPNPSCDEEEKSNENTMKTPSKDSYKFIDEEELYGPHFFQKGTHWSVSGSNWMNVIATGDENGVIYEKLFLPENNRFKKTNNTTLQLLVKKLPSSETPQTEFSNGYHYRETVQEFALETKFYSSNKPLNENQDDSQPLLRYPLDSINKVCWNQNFSSFRWLAIGTQSGFTLISPSQTISDNCINSFFNIILKPGTKNNIKEDN